MERHTVEQRAVVPFSPHIRYRDKIYIVKDIILKLVEYGELNQTALMTFCGLNLSKHRSILEELEWRGLIIRETITSGRKKSISIFKPTHDGMEFCRTILEPYEKMFPRSISLSSESNVLNRAENLGA